MSDDPGCLVVVDDQTMFLAGGTSTTLVGSKRAFVYKKESDSWTEMRSMTVGRQYHSCGYDSINGEIVVAGGVNDAYPLNSVEIFMVESLSWRDGESLPFALAGAYSTRFRNSFVLTGGFTYLTSDLSDSMVLYEPKNGTWMELEGKLKHARYNHVAIAVAISIFPECE